MVMRAPSRWRRWPSATASASSGSAPAAVKSASMMSPQRSWKLLVTARRLAAPRAGSWQLVTSAASGPTPASSSIRSMSASSMPRFEPSLSVDRLDRDAGLLGDVVDRRRCVTTLSKQTARGAEDVPAGLLGHLFAAIDTHPGTLDRIAISLDRINFYQQKLHPPEGASCPHHHHKPINTNAISGHYPRTIDNGAGELLTFLGVRPNARRSSGYSRSKTRCSRAAVRRCTCTTSRKRA